MMHRYALPLEHVQCITKGTLITSQNLVLVALSLEREIHYKRSGPPTRKKHGDKTNISLNYEIIFRMVYKKFDTIRTLLCRIINTYTYVTQLAHIFKQTGINSD